MSTLLLLSLLAAQEPTPLQRALNDMEPRGAWHYDDLPAGFAEAKKTGRPLCVVIRCPP